jgi:YVTN family beta-propeller protein
MKYKSQFFNIMQIKGLTLLLFTVLVACNTEDPEPISAYDKGILVLNEGNFGAGNGSMSFITENGEVSNAVFSAENGGLALGDVIQSISETDDLYLIVVNNSNVLYAIDKFDLQVEYSIATLKLPRYATYQDDYGYVTEWVSFTEPGRVTKFDLSSGEVVGTVTLGYGAEYPSFVEGDLYVSNNFESSVSIVDSENMAVTSSISTEPSPSHIIKLENGTSWLVCGGGYDANYAPANNGALQQLSNGSIISTIPLNKNVSGKIATKNNLVFVFSGQTVWEVNPDTPQITEVFTDDQVTSFYGIGIDESSNLFMTDSKGFQSAGEVILYTASGIREASYTVGIGPNSLIFR